ncbi:putative peptide zinc metalloprotease protein [Micromonospora pallida]|uniref:Putative peptide zinc metalloprotease protein n=1 Tax=Micromonospora pallida TaxID=145854 RepID=A0A1C6RLA2_9ACTN|nr:hypothetical protein [Micromonospora pallida]SCL17951.1 putative peptide zinc metalloprotease protein [Micromonospora pallida]
MSVIAPIDTNDSSGRGAADVAPRPDGRRPDSGDHLPGRTEDSRPEVVPARAPGLELLGELPGSGYRQPPGLVRRADGQTCQLTRLLYLLLDAIDGQRTYPEIAEVLSGTTSRLVTADNVRTLAEAKLAPLGLLRSADGTAPAAPRSNPLLALRFRFVVSNPRVTRRITAPFALLFRPFVVAVMLAAFLLSTGWVLFDKGLASATHQAFDEPGLLLLVFAITVVSAGFHEFGHAAACRYGGAMPGTMGVGLYLVWPAFYTNVDDSYRLGRAGRIRVDLGGLYFNAIVAVAIFATWAVIRWDALLLIIAAQVLQMIRQLAPFVRFDGYHILADLTGVPDLYSRIRPTLLGLLPTRWGRAESKVLKPWARVVVTVWVLTVVPLLLVSLVLVVTALPRVAATAWQSLGNHARLLATHWAAGDVPRVGVGLLAMLAICLPLLGIAYLLVRLVRQTVTSVWRATAGRPRRRAAAIIAGGALVAALVLTWWPDGAKYQPIQKHERGTVADALPMANRKPTAPQVDRPLHVGQRRTVTTVWPTAAPPPTEEQRLALVMVPRNPDQSGNGTPAPTWVFPFNPPEAPRAGDNQALSVNTQDGSTVYDVAFALVWATGDTVDNHNEAYALANCQNCQTVAVAFQVVLIVGPADVVVPQNISAAVNYSCRDCVTYALASQLVVTLPEGLSDEAKARLNALWEEIERFGQRIEGLSPQEIQAQLESYKEQILAIIEADAPAGPTPSGAPATTAPQSPSATATPAGSPTDTPSASPSPATSPTTPAPTTPAAPTGSPTPPDPSAEGTTPEPTSEPTPSAASEQSPIP